MDWSAEIGTNRNVLMRIAAILLALADLAERAAGASRPVRYQVLWALRQADEVVSEFVTGSTCEGGQWPTASTTACCGFDPADAENLAASLRMLAFMVQAMAARTSPGDSERERFVFSRARAGAAVRGFAPAGKAEPSLALSQGAAALRHAWRVTPPHLFGTTIARADQAAWR